MGLISAENVSCIDFILYIIKAGVIAISNNRMALCH